MIIPKEMVIPAKGIQMDLDAQQIVKNAGNDQVTEDTDGDQKQVFHLPAD